MTWLFLLHGEFLLGLAAGWLACTLATHVILRRVLRIYVVRRRP